MRRAASRGQYLVDVDRYIGTHVLNRSVDGGGSGGGGAQDDGGAQLGARVPLPDYCGGVLQASTARARTAPPPRPVRPPLPCAAAHQVRLGCTNDHCFVQELDAV